jgi:hypothetical protein
VQHNPMRGFEILLRLFLMLVLAGIGLLDVVVRTCRDIFAVILKEVLVPSSKTIRQMVANLEKPAEPLAPERTSIRGLLTYKRTGTQVSSPSFGD